MAFPRSRTKSPPQSSSPTPRRLLGKASAELGREACCAGGVAFAGSAGSRGRANRPGELAHDIAVEDTLEVGQHPADRGAVEHPVVPRETHIEMAAVKQAEVERRRQDGGDVQDTGALRADRRDAKRA